jgi:hypothetical protein
MPTLSAPNSAVVSFNKPGQYVTVDCSSGSTALVSWSGPGGTSGRRTVKNISEDVGPFVDGTTATVQALDGSCSYESSASVSGAGSAAADLAAFTNVPQRLQSSNGGASWLYKHAATTGTMRAAWAAYAPVGAGWFTGVALAQYWGGSATETTLGRMWLGKIGTYVHHSAATKTGAGWQGRTWDYAYNGDLTLSTVAGDQIAFAVSGAYLVLRTVTISNGGYAIVSIDGDWTAANRCPAFTAADQAAGRCRAGDVGKRYVNTYTAATCGWFDIPLADDLVDGAHTVVFEATGTKPAASGDVRAHIGGVVGCGASDVGFAVGAAGRTIAHVEGVYDSSAGSSAFVVVPEVRNAAGSAYEFLGEPHVGATEVSMVVACDGVDKTSLTAGTYQTAATIRFRRASTLASTDAPGTVAITKTMDLIVAGNGPAPVIASSKLAFAIAKDVRWHYACMLPLTSVQPADNGQQNSRFWRFSLGNGGYANTMPLTTNDGTDYGKVLAQLAEAQTDGGRIAYAVLLDPVQTVRNFALSTAAATFVTDYGNYEKVYFTRSESKSVESFAAGDVAQSLVGWGVVPRAAA